MRRLAILAAVLALAGCRTVGPTYHGPPPSSVVHAPAAAGPFVGAAGAGVSSAEPPDRWWRLYDDPTLDGLITQALAANTDLRVAAANLERAQAALAEARAARHLTTSVNAGVGYGHPAGEAFLLPESIPADFDYTASFSAAYQLDLFGRLRRAQEAASADVDAAAAARDAARVSVAAETARAYADLCGAGLRLAAAQRQLALQREAYALTVRLVRAGRGSAVDLTRTQTLIEQQRASIPALQAEEATDLYRLAVLAGRPPAAYRRDLAACAVPPRLTTPLPVGDGAALIRRRPDVRQAERQLAAATARIGVVTADLYPTVSFGASIGSTGLLRDLGAPATRAFDLGPVLSWTFPNRTAARARIAGASAAAAGALAHFDGVVLTSLRETETALTAYSHDLARDAALEAARAQAALALQQSQRLYRGGKEGYFTVVDAQRVLAGADAALAASRAQLSADQIAVFLALGGGWGT
jgi:NodT family efflux transporter outer membrane factor (OMF) lipoprotein